MRAAVLSSSQPQPALAVSLQILMISAFTFNTHHLLQSMLSHRGSGPNDEENQLVPSDGTVWLLDPPQQQISGASIKRVRKPDYFRFVCRQRGAGAAAFSHPRVWNCQRQGQTHSQASHCESAPPTVLHIPQLFTFYRSFCLFE